MFTFAGKHSQGRVVANSTEELDKLKPIAIPKRKNTTTWKGIKHHDLATILNQELSNPVITDSGEKLTFKIDEQKWAVDQEQDGDLFGDLSLSVFDSKGKNLNGLSGELNYNLSVVHSNLSRRSLQFFVSAKVLVCANGYVADHVFDRTKRKHTKNIDVRSEVQRGIQNYVARMHKISEQVEEMKQIELTRPQVNDVLVYSAERGIIAYSGIGKVLREYTNPRHPEFKPNTAWSLYNAYTEVAKEMSITNQMRTIGGVRWAMADAGLMALPEHARFS